MTDIRYYTDEHVAKAVATGLRQRNIDVLTVQQAGMLGATDLEHLEFARSEKRITFSQDDDFLRLAAAGHEHAGIIYAPQQTPIGEIVRGLALIYHVLSTEDMANHIEFL